MAEAAVKFLFYPASHGKSLKPEQIEAIKATLSAWPIVVNDVYAANTFRPERIQILYGGSGSGKSDFKATELLIKVLVQPFCRVLFVRKFREQVRDSQFLLLKGLIKRYGLEQFFQIKESEMDIVCKHNGNLLMSGGLDDVDKLKSIPDITDIWIEEPMDRKGAVSSSDFTELNRRLRCPLASNHIHLTFNPISKDSWIHDYFFKSNAYGAFTLKTTYKDNYYSTPEQAAQYEILKDKKPEEYAVYALGEWGSLKQGLVFPEYQIIDAMPKECRRRGYGLDWGFYPDPCALVDVGIYNGGLYIDEIIYENNLTSGPRVQMMRDRGVPFAARIVADRAPETIEEHRKLGYRGIVAAIKGPGSVVEGINLMRGFKIYITARSKNVKRELDNYSWKVDKRTDSVLNEPEDAFNHTIDAVRYAVVDMVKPGVVARINM